MIGVLGLLLDAKACGAVKPVQPHLNALRQTAGFHLADAVYDHALSLAGETVT